MKFLLYSLLAVAFLGSPSEIKKQETGVSSYVSDFNATIVKAYQKEGGTFEHIKYAPMLLDGEVVESMQAYAPYTLSDLKSILISFDPKHKAVFGQRAHFGVIEVELKVP